MPAAAIQQRKTKLLSIFLGVALIGEMIWAIFYLTDPLKFVRNRPTLSPLLSVAPGGAVLFLDPPLGEFIQGTPAQINVVLDSQGDSVFGADVILRFDPNFWEISDGDSAAEGIQVFPGTIFSRYLANKVNFSQGRVTLSGLAEADQPFSGRGILARIQLVPKKVGTTKIFFDYQPEATNDSNVAGLGSKDLLDKVVGGEYIIKQR